MKSIRKSEIIHMLKGLTSRIRLVRDDIGEDHDPGLTSHLWKAELEIGKAAKQVQEAPTEPD